MCIENCLAFVKAVDKHQHTAFLLLCVINHPLFIFGTKYHMSAFRPHIQTRTQSRTLSPKSNLCYTLITYHLLATFILYEITKFVFEERGHRTFVSGSDFSAH